MFRCNPVCYRYDVISADLRLQTTTSLRRRLSTTGRQTGNLIASGQRHEERNSAATSAAQEQS